MSGALWLVLTIPVFLLAVVLLIRAVVKLVGAAWAEPLAAVPLAQPPAGSDSIESAIELPSAGAVSVAGEGKRFTTDFARIALALADASTGRAVPLQKSLMRATTSGVSRVRV
jgi:hypothetical protein